MNTTARHPDTNWATPSPTDSLVAYGRLVHPSHALARPPSAACEARATVVGGWCVFKHACGRKDEAFLFARAE